MIHKRIKVHARTEIVIAFTLTQEASKCRQDKTSSFRYLISSLNGNCSFNQIAMLRSNLKLKKSRGHFLHNVKGAVLTMYTR